MLNEQRLTWFSVGLGVFVLVTVAITTQLWMNGRISGVMPGWVVMGLALCIGMALDIKSRNERAYLFLTNPAYLALIILTISLVTLPACLEIRWATEIVRECPDCTMKIVVDEAGHSQGVMALKIFWVMIVTSILLGLLGRIGGNKRRDAGVGG